jgi:4-aminobutyrate aminotransferase
VRPRPTDQLQDACASVHSRVRPRSSRDPCIITVHSSTLYLIRPQIELAEEIAGLAPIPDAKVFFTTSGTEAIEMALLLATTARRSNQILAMRNSHHGRSFAAMGITGNRGWSASSLTPVNVSYVYGGYRYRSPFARLDDDAFIAACVDDLRNVIETTTSGDVACLIAEPVQGVGGFTYPPDGLYRAFKDVLDEYGILFVADEVQTGWGRIGTHFWGIQAHGVEPDVVVFAKGLANGLSIGGVVARAGLMEQVPANSISTFGGNHLSSVAALANLAYLRKHDLRGNAMRVGEVLRTRLQSGIGAEPIVGEVRGKGPMLAVECVEAGSTRPSTAAAVRVLEEARRRGVLVGRGGLLGNVIRITPPLSLTAEQAERGAQALVEAVRAAAG